MTTARARIGRIGEVMAARHLEALGMTVCARNWRCAAGAVRGELDVIAWDDGCLVVCEVKTRRLAADGDALLAVTPQKLRQLRRLAAAYVQHAGCRAADVRFDAVGVWWPRTGGRAQIEHVRGIE